MSGFTWSNENVFKLIELFQGRQLLWNTQIDDYKDRNKKHDAWMQIANEFNLDKQSIEKKIRSLIGQFQRESKKHKSGAGADDVSKWFAYKKLLFLKDRNKPEETIDGGFTMNEWRNEQQMSDTNTDSKTPKEKTFTVPKTFRKRNRPQVTEDRTSEEALKLLKDMCESRRVRDENDIFGEYVASKLREINNKYARNAAQYHINNILFSASMGEYVRPNNTTDTPSNAAGAFRGYKSAPSPSTSPVKINTGYREYKNEPSPSKSSVKINTGYREYKNEPSPSTSSFNINNGYREYENEPSPSTSSFNINNGYREYENEPSPSTSTVNISTGCREYKNEPSPSTSSDNNSTQSFDDLLQAIHNK